MKRAQPICGYTLHVQFVYASCMAVSGESLRMPCEIIRRNYISGICFVYTTSPGYQFEALAKRLILQIFLEDQHLSEAEIKHHTLYDTTRRS